MGMTRRQLLQVAAGVGVLSGFPQSLFAEAGSSPATGSAVPFSFERVRKLARALAQRPFEPASSPHSDVLKRIGYDAHQEIGYRSGQALWGNQGHRLPVEFFHQGKYFKRPVAMHAVHNGEARRIPYEPGLFDYGDVEFAEDLPEDLGFAGFRVLNPEGRDGDWLAFLGASYFRSAGPLNQYGLSARGIAVNTQVPGVEEEFPAFTEFWLEQPDGQEHRLTVYALLEGPSLTGAYRFDCTLDVDESVRTDVHADLFMREDIEQLGIAPLTSMYWYSETNHRQAADWRPEIHDSDGLAIWTGDGERIWRPLNSPPHPQTNTFSDRSPRGFGLLQRDRDFDHYQDDGVFYNRRPSAWIEPVGDWGQGSVLLMELPTNDEVDDNIVAFWQPKEPARTGEHRQIDYRMYWVAEEPHIPAVAHVIATRIGRSGVPGQQEERDPNGRKFVIDFTGGPLDDLDQRYDLEVVVESSRGETGNAHCLKVVGTDYWRASFDLHADGDDKVDLRCFVRLGEQTLTETWIYQYFPAAHPLP